MNVVDYKLLTYDIDKIMMSALAVSGVIVVLFLMFSVLFFRGIIIPINSLIKKMKIIEKGDFNVHIKTEGKGEIYQLGKSFDRMVHEIKKLIAEKDLKEKERIKAEIEALQSQINPHFLSNTLNSIRLMAMIKKVDSIKNMTEAFMKLLMATFGKGGTFVPIKEELDNLGNYIYIMKVRYGDRFNVIFDVSEEIKDYCILKLILQPIVENSILHGINDMDKKGTIHIRGYLYEHNIKFEIEDNGRGMNLHEITRLLMVKMQKKQKPL